MLSLEQAQEKIFAQLSPLPAGRVPLRESHGLFLREDVSAALDLPRFDNSAMDGYALRSGDLQGASVNSPVHLHVAGKVAAGQDYQSRVGPGECVRLFTGSPVPPGADAVVMQEDVELSGEQAVFREPAKPFENIRLRGEDVRAGSVIARAGKKLTAPVIGLLGAAGVAELSASKPPRVSLLATGNELREPGAPLEAGEIYESNRAMLAAGVAEAGAVAEILPIVPDQLERTMAALEGALARADAVITSGGVSVGEFDFVKGAIEKLGGSLEFWRVAVKPGKPFVFGQCGGKPIFGLPGNPVSAWVTFLLLVRPALLRLQGASEYSLPRVFGLLSARLTNPGDRRHFVRVRLGGDGRVAVSGPQASHMLGGLAEANGLADLGPGAVLEAGEQVPVLLWEKPGD